MVDAVAKSIAASWQRLEDKAGTSLGKDLSLHLLQADDMTELSQLSGCLTSAEHFKDVHSL